MSLRPLRFFRFPARAGVDGRAPIYGSGFYKTDCDRFYLRRYVGAWVVGPSVSGDYRSSAAWSRWFERQGLRGARFATRREALEALETCLDADGLLGAVLPIG